MKFEDPSLRQLREEYELLKVERSVVDDVLNDIDYFFMPSNGHMFFADNENRYNELAIRWRNASLMERGRYLDTGVQSADALASTIHSTLLAPSIRWFEMSIPPAIQRLSRISPQDADILVRYMMDVNHTMFENIQMSNFSSEAASLLHSDVVHGTAVLQSMETEDDPYEMYGPALSFVNVPLSEFYFTEDFDGILCRCYRRQYKTLAQLIEKFGIEALPEALRNKWNQGGEGAKTEREKYELVHVSYPRYDRKRSGTMRPQWKKSPAASRPWAGGFFLIDSKEQAKSDEFIKMEAYYENPYHLARWSKRTGSKWGYSPAHKSLDSMLTLNRAVELTLHAGAAAIQPPLKALNNSVIHPFNMSPSGVTVVRDMDGLQPLHVAGDINIGVEFWDRFKAEVEENFYIDKLRLKESPEMTATEVQARWRMLNRFIGPSLTRLQDDFLTPLLHRVHMILYRKGIIDPAPYNEMLGYWAPPVYKGPIARAQRAEEAEAQDALLGTVAIMIQAGSPELAFAIKPWGFIKNKADMLELDWTEYLEDESTAQRLMQQAQAQQQKMMAAQTQNEQAQAQERQAKAQGAAA